MEILAPAGDMEVLRAAIAAGCDAVYLGLATLNARRGARNFTPDELAMAVKDAHAKNVRVYLTLNIDIAQRELGQAIRMLKLAEDCGVDAVLVRDPAVIGWRRLFPRLAFHFSTQTCIANSLDVRAAGDLGAARVVLARELSLAEIAACSKSGDVETEVFVQGALCFCISGRCLLSSWVGGHSGNRGTCTSPCRVPWMAGTESLGTPLSMKDLTAVGHIDDLQRAGVKALKIEGRLKSPNWVSQAVGLYKQAIEGGDPASLLDQANQLGAYAGRPLTSGYLDARRDDLIAQSAGRQAAALPPADSSQSTAPPAPADPADPAASPEPQPTGIEYDLAIDITDQGIVCTVTLGERHLSWTMPKTQVRRQYKAVPVSIALGQFEPRTLHNCNLRNGTSNNLEYLMVPRAANTLIDLVSSALRQLLKPEDETLRLDLPEEIRAAIARAKRHAANTKLLGDAPNRARLESKSVAEFVRRIKAAGQRDAMPQAILVEHATADQLEQLIAASAGTSLIVALPPVFFEADILAIQQLVTLAVALNLAVEVNSWGGWKLAKDCGARVEAGPGLGVLNAAAAQMLHQNGCACVSIAVEADRQQMEDLTSCCAAPCALTVFGRPALMITRVQLSADQLQGRVLQDRREVQVKARLEHGLWTLRPVEPFDLRPVRNKSIQVAHLIVELVASPDPAGEWLRKPFGGEKTLRFNYGRTLA